MKKKDDHYPIRVVALKTGLTPHVIRAWERRYGSLSPERTETNRRIYTDEDVDRLLLLRRATEAGYSIGQVAALPREKLLELVASSVEDALPRPPESTGGDRETAARSHLESSLDAASRLDTAALEHALNTAAVALSQPVLVEQVVGPLMERIGDLWRDGTIRVANEHLVSSVVRTFLGRLVRTFESPSTAPNIVVTTPSGQLHEIGAFMAALIALAEGWRVTYLGPNLPAEEIAAAARQSQAKAVALSIIYPPDDPNLADEMARVRRLLPDTVPILVGGRSASAYQETLHAVGATVMAEIKDFKAKLESLRDSHDDGLR